MHAGCLAAHGLPSYINPRKILVFYLLSVLERQLCDYMTFPIELGIVEDMRHSQLKILEHVSKLLSTPHPSLAVGLESATRFQWAELLTRTRDAS